MNKPEVNRKQRAEQDPKSGAESKTPDGQLDEGQLDEVAGGMSTFWKYVGKAWNAVGGGGGGGDSGGGSGGGIRG